MSQAEQQFIESLREDGTLDTLHRQMGRAPEAPVEQTDTVEEPEEAEQSPIAAEEAPSVVEPEAQVEEPAPEVEYTFDPTPETEEFLSKYDGDLTKALRGAAELSTLYGRQANEVGELRRELQEMRDAFSSYQAQPGPYRTYIPDPDEADEEEMAAAYASIAHEAIERADADTLGRAVEAWGEIQPFQASQFVSRLQQQAYANQLAQLQAGQGSNETAERIQALKQKYPDLPQYVEEIGREAQNWPTLGRILEDATPAERVQALEELYLRVANRTSSETSQQALRRVAVKTSEEARKARQQAQVASSGRGPVAEPEASPRLLALGRTGRFVDLNRVDEILQSDRI